MSEKDVERTLWMLERQMVSVEELVRFWQLYGEGLMPIEPSKDVL